MRRRTPLIRLPQSFVIFALLVTLGVAIISGGVTVTQALGGIGWRGADWTVFRWALMAAAVVVALCSSGLVDWISDDEIARLQEKEYGQSLAARIARRIPRRMLTAFTLAVMLADCLWQFVFDRHFVVNAPLPDGGYGAAIDGMTFGSVRLFGRIWSGVDLAFITPLTIALLLLLRAGFTRIVQANSSREE